jgi:hypothetical protein
MKRLLTAGVAMRGTELLRLRPGGERLLACPHRVRGIQGEFFVFGSSKQVEGDKAGDLIEVAIAIKPSPLKSRLLTPDNPEAIHRDEHSITPWHEGERLGLALANFYPF